MRRCHIQEEMPLPGYDSLRAYQADVPPRKDWSFAPNRAYDAYFRMHKVFVGESGGRKLEAIADQLEDEWMPGYMDVAGWAAAEAALVQKDRSAADRIELINQAVEFWERGLVSQEQINRDEGHEWLQEDSESYRLALNLAFAPLIKAMIVGNVTESTRERVFADTLAIAQASIVQLHLAHAAGDKSATSDHSGLGHELNALLTLLYMNDPRYLPLPSHARAGSGYDYPEQTHDIVVINQHWGNILKIVPIEIKAKSSRRDLQRYKALIVRGKMHLSVPGKYASEHTTNALAAMYEGTGTAADEATVQHATSTMRELLQLYQKGKRIDEIARAATRFHNRDEVEKVYKEFSLDRLRQKPA